MLEKSFINKKLILSIITTMILVVFTWKICPIMFQNNDDKFLLYMIAGYTTGTQSLATVFGGFLWAGFISLFYKIYAGITWYTVITLIAIVASLVVICRTLIEEKEKSGVVFGILSFIGLFFVYLCYFATAIQYTVTAAYVGVAGVCALFLGDWAENPKARIAYIATAALLITTSFSIRKQMGLVTMSCAAIVLFFLFLRQGEKRKFAFKTGMVILLAFAVVYVSNMVYEKATGLAEFNKDYAIVQRWIDYPHIDIAEDANGVYNSVGWDQELYDAATEWFFLDERVTPENIQVINDASADATISFSERVDRAMAAITNKQMVNVQVALWIIVLVIANVALITRKKDRDELLSLLCADALFLFFALLAFYFCFLQGRFPLRVYQALVLIYFIPSLGILLKTLEQKECKKSVFAIAIVMILAVPVCYKLYPVGSMFYQAKLATHDVDRENIIAEVTALEVYAADHKDNLYIYDYELSQPSAPFVNFGKNMPYNILFWGGWTYDSPVYYQQLKANGLDELLSKDLVDGNVYLCGKEVDQVIYKYMESQFGELKTEIIDKVGDVIIYRYIYK